MIGDRNVKPELAGVSSHFPLTVGVVFRPCLPREPRVVQTRAMPHLEALFKTHLLELSKIRGRETGQGQV